MSELCVCVCVGGGGCGLSVLLIRDKEGKVSFEASQVVIMGKFTN